MNRFLVKVAAIGLTLLLVAGCGSGTAVPTSPPEAQEPTAVSGEKIRIAVFTAVLGNTYNQAVVDGVAEAAKAIGAEVVGFSAEYDSTLQINQIQDAITSGKYAAFVVEPTDGVLVAPIVDQAIAAGILVGAADAPVGTDRTTLQPYPGLIAYAAVPCPMQGKAFGEMIVDACQGKNPCKVAYMIGMSALKADQERLEAMHAVLASHPEIQIVSEQEAAYMQDTGLSVMQGVLQAHPDLDVVASAGDQMSLGAAKAVADAGLTGKVTILGNGASKEAIPALKDGTLHATFALLPFTEGRLVGEALVRALQGGDKTAKVIDVTTMSPPLPPGGPVITKDNVDQFVAEW